MRTSYQLLFIFHARKYSFLQKPKQMTLFDMKSKFTRKNEHGEDLPPPQPLGNINNNSGSSRSPSPTKPLKSKQAQPLVKKATTVATAKKQQTGEDADDVVEIMDDENDENALPLPQLVKKNKPPKS
jgi:hypothetical protein